MPDQKPQKSDDIDQSREAYNMLMDAIKAVGAGNQVEADRIELEMFRKYINNITPFLDELEQFRALAFTPSFLRTMMELFAVSGEKTLAYVKFLEDLCKRNNIDVEAEVDESQRKHRTSMN